MSHKRYRFFFSSLNAAQSNFQLLYISLDKVPAQGHASFIMLAGSVWATTGSLPTYGQSCYEMLCSLSSFIIPHLSIFFRAMLDAWFSGRASWEKYEKQKFVFVHILINNLPLNRSPKEWPLVNQVSSNVDMESCCKVLALPGDLTAKPVVWVEKQKKKVAPVLRR